MLGWNGWGGWVGIVDEECDNKLYRIEAYICVDSWSRHVCNCVRRSAIVLKSEKGGGCRGEG